MSSVQSLKVFELKYSPFVSRYAPLPPPPPHYISQFLIMISPTSHPVPFIDLAVACMYTHEYYTYIYGGVYKHLASETH